MDCSLSEFLLPMPRPSFAERTKKLFLRIICCGDGASRPFQVFIVHRGPETKRNLAALSHNKLMKRDINTFLDFKSIKPGDITTERINSALSECQIGVILITPDFFKSFHCMYELARLVEMNKTLISVLCDVGPEELRIPRDDTGDLHYEENRKRFSDALAAVRERSWIPFKKSSGDWSQLLDDISAAVIGQLSDI